MLKWTSQWLHGVESFLVVKAPLQLLLLEYLNPASTDEWAACVFVLRFTMHGWGVQQHLWSAPHKEAVFLPPTTMRPKLYPDILRCPLGGKYVPGWETPLVNNNLSKIQIYQFFKNKFLSWKSETFLCPVGTWWNHHLATSLAWSKQLVNILTTFQTGSIQHWPQSGV